MNVGDLVYIRIGTAPLYNGSLLFIKEVLPEGYYVVIMEGPNIGQQYYIRGDNVVPIEFINL
jgi:small nuclear ribonucleoprotein (snRNP)-like protein